MIRPTTEGTWGLEFKMQVVRASALDTTAHKVVLPFAAQEIQTQYMESYNRLAVHNNKAFILVI